MAEKPSKIAIIGAGSVGATIAYACLIRGVGKAIALYDLSATKVNAEVLDLNHVRGFLQGLKSGDVALIKGSRALGLEKALEARS